MSPNHSSIDDSEPPVSGSQTADAEYAERLYRLSNARWKRILDVQRPYRWNLRRLELGRCLDVGCGIGRNLKSLQRGSVGVDHNETAIAICRRQGLAAYTSSEFFQEAIGGLESFDSMLVAHVLEHLDEETSNDLIHDYLPFIKRGGLVVFITPQEVGFRSDSTHVRWVDHIVAGDHAQRAGLVVDRAYSFPFPRKVGKVFIYNEFVTVTHKP